MKKLSLILNGITFPIIIFLGIPTVAQGANAQDTPTVQSYDLPPYMPQATNSAGHYPVNVGFFSITSTIHSVRTPCGSGRFFKHQNNSTSGMHTFSLIPRQQPETKVKCSIQKCESSFVRKADLTCHILVKHPEYARENNLFFGEFPCTQKNCDARFPRKKALNSHIKNYHRILNYHVHAPTPTGNETMDDDDIDGDNTEMDLPPEQNQKPAQPQNKFSIPFICPNNDLQ
jgi:hypothetical protein